MKTVTVDAATLRKLLVALNGPYHHITELQATMRLPGNPINDLTDAYNKALEEYNKEQS